MKTGFINTKYFSKGQLRIDPSFHLSSCLKYYSLLKRCFYSITSIKDCSSEVFLGNIFSRIFVADEDNGVSYISPSCMTKKNPSTGKYIANKQAKQLKRLLLKDNYILISCSGTIGNVVLTNKLFDGKIASHDLIRVIPNEKNNLSGVLYAYLASSIGHSFLTQSKFGGVVKHINDEHVEQIPIPIFPDDIQNRVNTLIKEAKRLREEASDILNQAERILKTEANLRDLNVDDYNYYGSYKENREVSCFVRNSKKIGSLTFHAFNHSERIRKTVGLLKSCNTIPLYDAFDESKLQSPSGVSVIELEPNHGIMLINQSDIFDNMVKGKWVANRPKYKKQLLQYGEVLIAKIGTLGEGETFCRTVFVGEELAGQLVSSAFYRLKGTEECPSGYIFTWLNSDYGFRFLRSTQYGTKQCYPNPTILYDLPIPIIEKSVIIQIDNMVKKAHTMRFHSNENEKEAISIIESEFEKWNKH